MVATSQIESRLAFEPHTAPIEPVSGGASAAARQSTKPDFLGGSSNASPQKAAGDSEQAYSIEISDEAQRVAANDPGNAPRTEAPRGPNAELLNSTVETSATSELNAPADTAARDDGVETNQVTSFESERTGNDTRNESEAGRTLGQVIDTFA